MPGFGLRGDDPAEERQLDHRAITVIGEWCTEHPTVVYSQKVMKFVATKTADQFDLQALHRVRERLASQRTGINN